MTTSQSLTITAEQKRQYVEDGYFVLERAMTPDQLAIVRNDLQSRLDAIHAEMDQQGRDVIGINHRGKRYFISNRWQTSARLPEFIFSDLLATICRATLGENAYLFNEQYVVKCAEVGMKFAWHQDSGYVGYDHAPYLSCWCALDDMTIENGTVYMLPYARAGTREWVRHTPEAGTNDLVGYLGSDPGEPVRCPAGSIAVFSSVCFHRSGVNTTPNMRRVYLAQYTREVLRKPDGSGPWALAEPFLRNGQRVR